MEASKPGLLAAWRDGGLRSLADMMRVDWHRSMWSAIRSSFETPHLRQLFARYATYYGSSPYSAPATLNLIAEVEREGVWVVDGGMHELALAMGRLFEEVGGELRLSTPVEELRPASTGWEVVSGGRSERFDAVVFNGHPRALSSGALGEPARKAVRMSTKPDSASALTWCAQGHLQGDFEADFHNVFFSEDYRAEFDALFGKTPKTPDEPSVYLCAQSRAPGRLRSADEPEALFLLVNSPATGEQGQPPSEQIKACEARVQTLLRRCGLELQVEAQTTTTPADFATRFPSSRGALYGEATHSPFTPFFRQTARSRLSGLYLAGGSTHPGAGIPMACMSGRFAAQAIAKDLPLTAPSSPVDIFGGTSTSSAKTAARR
jgi:1-hydroxycarotenoid 3,4-desaturase